MSEEFIDKVRVRAYFKYKNRQTCGIHDDSTADWNEAYREQIIEERIQKEAYFHYLNGCKDDDFNWNMARSEIHDRIAFIAFYMHEKNINNSPTDNWVNAQYVYIQNF